MHDYLHVIEILNLGGLRKLLACKGRIYRATGYNSIALKYEEFHRETGYIHFGQF